MRRLVIALGALSSLIGIVLIGAAAFQYQDYLERLAQFEERTAECDLLGGQAEFYCGKGVGIGRGVLRSENIPVVASNLAIIGIIPIGAGMALFLAGRQ